MMNTDDRKAGDQTSGERSSLQLADEMEEIIDLVDLSLADDLESELIDLPDDAQRPGEAGKAGKAGEELIELTDAVEDFAQEESVENSAIGLEFEETSALELEGLEDEEIVDLVDESTGKLGLEDEEILELHDVAEVQGFRAEGDSSELSEGYPVTEQSDEDSLLEDMGLEIPETAPGIPPVAGELEQEATTVWPTDEALESDVLDERVSEERIEAIITRVVNEVIEKKAGQILLEAAETAISKEIEKIKRAL
jgi:hypothetical protein